MIALEPQHDVDGAWIEVPGGVTAPPGFLASGVHCGIRRARADLALIVSEGQAACAGVFTTNLVKAAPLLVSMEHLRSGRARAIVVVSGNANACTGQRGLEDARTMARETACALGISAEEVVVASTGVIGVPLPVDKVTTGIRCACDALSPGGSGQAAEAILTTDRATKEMAVTGYIGGRKVSIGGIAKGSGMIHPNMATMLAFITTDALVTPAMLQLALRRSTEESFNMITVDGDTSTNDMAVVMANGLAQNPLIAEEGVLLDDFVEGLSKVSLALAKMIASDGEGATKLIEVTVSGARTQQDARQVARTVASSSLVKTAVFGADPNWGRILAAAGRSGADFDPMLVDVYIGESLVASAGIEVEFDEAAVRNQLSRREVALSIHLHAGREVASAWTCDLTYDYVRINASYRT